LALRLPAIWELCHRESGSCRIGVALIFGTLLACSNVWCFSSALQLALTALFYGFVPA
jgi:hypothetical protein